MALGNMSYTEGRECAANLGTSAANMDEFFNQLRAEMNSLEEVLKSKGADELFATYKGLEAKLNSFPDKVRGFQGFLTSAIEQYEADDAALSSQAGQ